MIVHIPDEPHSLDSQLAVSEVERLIIRNVQEGLLDYDPNGRIIPLLAALPPQPAGGDRWILTLRSGVFFHDGNELEADDVVFTFKRLKNSPFDIQKGKIFEKLLDIRAIDRHQVELITDGPCPNLCDLLTRPELFPLSAQAVEKYGSHYGKVILVGTGPFFFQNWVKGKYITLIKNKDYRNPALPYLNSISFEFHHPVASRIKSLRSLRAHIATGITPQAAVALEKDRRIHIYHRPGQNLVQIYLNSDRPPFDKKALRLALVYGIDYGGLVNEVLGAYALAAESCIPSWSWAHKKEYQPIEYNPERARLILQTEGYDDQNPFRFTLLVNKDPFFLQQALYIKESLARIPILADIKAVSKAELFDSVYGRNGKSRDEFQAALEDWEDLRYGRDPRQFTAELYASSSSYNKTRLSDLVLDNIFEEIDRSPTLSAQQELYFAAERRIMNSVPVVNLCFPHHILAARTRVQNLQVNLFNEIDFKEVWLLR
ncbi:MAG: ABC transporter substrate-binding protein [bacterium]